MTENDDTSDSDDSTDLLDTAADRIAEAGAESEADTERDGAFSYHTETHAGGIGLSAGLLVSTTGSTRWASALLGAALLNSDADTDRTIQINKSVKEDIKAEPHYFLGGFAFGLILGNLLTLLTKGEAYGVTIADVIRDAVQFL